MKINRLLAAIILLLLPFIASAEEAYPWLTGICPKPCIVLNGPADYLHKSDGPKAILDPNTPVRVLGEEDGFVLIQYKVSETCVPFGYVPEDALTIKVPPLKLNREYAYPLPAETDWQGTDDPLGEAALTYSTIPTLDVSALFEIDGWMYIEDYHSGSPFRYFMRRENMEYGRFFSLKNFTNQAVSGTFIIDRDMNYKIDCMLTFEESEKEELTRWKTLFLIGQDEQVITRIEQAENGHFLGTGKWDKNAYGADFLFVDAEGENFENIDGFWW